MSKPSDLVQGTLDLLTLKILALEPFHGWAVSQRLTQVSGDVLQVSDGSLYPALHKLEQEGWITAEWKTSELGRRAKFYSLTRSGRRHLEKETADWERLSTAISGSKRFGRRSGRSIPMYPWHAPVRWELRCMNL
jgi:PadR family transcriptional regulator PadR